MGDNNFSPTKEDLEKNVTLGTLLEYTDEFLIPKMGEMMDEKFGILDKRIDGLDGKIGKLRNELIDHVERTVNNAKRDIIQDITAAYNKRHEQYRMAFEKIMAILQRSNLAAAEEVKAVYEIIA